MQKPWSRVIRRESESDIICTTASADCISANGILIIVCIASSDSHDVHDMLNCHLIMNECEIRSDLHHVNATGATIFHF